MSSFCRWPSRFPTVRDCENRSFCYGHDLPDRYCIIINNTASVFQQSHAPVLRIGIFVAYLRLVDERTEKVSAVSWTAKKTNEWVLNNTGVKRGLLDTVKARKLAYYGHTMRKRGSRLKKEIMLGTQTSKATHGLDGQQDVDETLRGRVNQNDRGQG